MKRLLAILLLLAPASFLAQVQNFPGGLAAGVTSSANTLNVGTTGTGTLNVGTSGQFSGSINIIGVGSGANLNAGGAEFGSNTLVWSGPGATMSAYGTASNCSSSASPAVCGSAASGSVVVAAAATTVQVNTTAVTANSQILLTRDDSLGTKLSVTCNTATVMGEMKVSARTSGTSFTITVQTTPATNPGCISYTVIN